MTRLMEEMAIARSKQSNLGQIKKLNCWGTDLTDVSIIKKMPEVEVLSFSVNNIKSLQPFENCTKLQELYLRKNNIQDIGEIRYLQKLPELRCLWLADNPCCQKAGTNYRAVVLRFLPNLKKLDNIDVTEEELENALQYNGDVKPQQNVVNTDQQDQPAQHAPHQLQHSQRRCSRPKERSSGSSQESPCFQVRAPISSSNLSYTMKQYLQSDHPTYPVRHSQTDLTSRGLTTAERDRYNCQNVMTRENGEWVDCDRSRLRTSSRPDLNNTVSAAALNYYSGYHRRPINRNSNLVSAILCLINELNYSSLEVIEHAVHIRIGELSN